MSPGRKAGGTSFAMNRSEAREKAVFLGTGCPSLSARKPRCQTRSMTAIPKHDDRSNQHILSQNYNEIIFTTVLLPEPGFPDIVIIILLKFSRHISHTFHHFFNSLHPFIPFKFLHKFFTHPILFYQFPYFLDINTRSI